MKFSRVAAWAGILLLAACGQGSAAGAEPAVWQPSPGHTQIPLWPGAALEAPSVPGPETLKDGGVTNVTRPTLTVYGPRGKNTGAAVIVIPGGGFQMLGPWTSRGLEMLAIG